MSDPTSAGPSPQYSDFLNTTPRVGESTSFSTSPQAGSSSGFNIDPMLEDAMPPQPVSATMGFMPRMQQMLKGFLPITPGMNDYDMDPLEAAREQAMGQPDVQMRTGESPTFKDPNYDGSGIASQPQELHYNYGDPSLLSTHVDPWMHIQSAPIEPQHQHKALPTANETISYASSSYHDVGLGISRERRHGRPRALDAERLRGSPQQQASQAQPNRSTPRRKSSFRAEKPVKDNEHDWVRINGSTQGRSSRTGKINSYDPKVDGGYRDNRHPDGNWTGPLTGKEFAYTLHGELRERVFTAAQINDFLFSHVRAANCKLTIWIQKTPADCARRYPTRGSDKCLFAECPFKVENRNILVGHMRVAFDEQWDIHGARRDPFHLAGYTHLYCLERFCDFPEIAHSLDVRPDSRTLRTEPRGVWGASLGENRMAEEAALFIKACKQRSLNNVWPDYPYLYDRAPLADFDSGNSSFERTLTFALTDAKLKETNTSKRNMMLARGLKPSNILVHKGNIQQLVDSKQKEKRRKKSEAHEDMSRNIKRSIRQVEEDDASSELSDAPSDDDELPPARTTLKRKAAGAALKRVRLMSDADIPEAAPGPNEGDGFEAEQRPTKRHKPAPPHLAVGAPVAPMNPRSVDTTDAVPSLPSQTAPTPVSRRADLMESMYGSYMSNAEDKKQQQSPNYASWFA